MARYRRKRYGRRSTNVVKMKFQSFMDISTNDTSMQIITISAGGKEILRRLAPQFGAYKYYKIGNIAVKLVPASTLPVDPTGLSYEAGEPGVDPRDQLTPGMMRITNGEDVFEDITGLSDAVQHGIYNNMLLDPRWYKWMLQSGVKRHAFPKYWQIGQLHQDKWPGSVVNIPIVDDTNGFITGTEFVASRMGASAPTTTRRPLSSEYGLFQTGHKGVLGWMPTDALQHVYRATADGGDFDDPMLASPPEIEVMKIILPKAYKTRYYYRMFITETVYFREPIVNFGIPFNDAGQTVRPLDVFHVSRVAGPASPAAQDGPDPNIQNDVATGGNYGNS